MTRANNRKFKIITFITSAFLVFCGAFGLSLKTVVANGGGDDTDEGGASGGGCGDWWDTCYGATWRKYPLDYSLTKDAYYSAGDDVVHILNRYRSSDGSVSVYGGTLNGCGGYGADEYYRLGLEAYRSASGTRLGYQAGLITVGSIYNREGGSGVFNAVNFKEFSDTEQWDDVKRNYQTAYDKGYVTLGWSNISAFCWNEAWAASESEFKSTSSVSGSGISTTTTNYDENNKTVSTEITTTSYTATFWHNIHYFSGFTDAPDDATFDEVATNWTVASYSITPSSATTSVSGGTLPKSDKYIVSAPKNNATSGNLSQTSITITVPEGETVTVCQQISYNPKKISLTPDASGRYTDATTSGNGSSSICIQVKNTTTPAVGSDGFWAKSQLEIPAQNGDVSAITTDIEKASTKDGSTSKRATVKVSTDGSSLTVNFTHKMYYGDKLWKYSEYTPTTGTHAVKSADVFPNICSSWSVSQSGDLSGSVGSGTFCTNKAGTNSGTDANTNTQIIIPLNPGDHKTVCQTFQHNKKSVTLTRSHDDYCCGYRCGSTCHRKYTYSESTSSGEGSTELCVEVDRPEEPSGTGPSQSGGLGNELMFAGQTAGLNWSTLAKPSETRRLGEYQAIAYVLGANTTHNANNTKGNIPKDSSELASVIAPNRKNHSPCQWYSSVTGIWCEVVDSKQENWDPNGRKDEHSYNGGEVVIKVPNEVGQKYCNSFGYRWEYWYAIKYEDTAEAWTHETAKDYWTNYNAACRSIAKKPTTAVWNGGIKAGGSLVTSLANRFINVSTTHSETTASKDDYEYMFGSWTEHLAIANGNVSGFVSGSALARGSNWDTSHDGIYPNLSTMTVANDTSSLGGAAIPASSTLRTRLATYLSSQPTSTLLSNQAVSSVGGFTVNDNKTHIYTSSGGMDITGDIKLNTSYSSIYAIPQVIIFANGDVNIYPNVKQIDAWIIATGTIHTCKQRESDVTIETAAVGRSNNTICDEQLVVNGPVIAANVTLDRSYGADPVLQGKQYTPGEIFNLSTEAYLWAYAQAGRYSSSYTEAYSRELAPRY